MYELRSKLVCLYGSSYYTAQACSSQKTQAYYEICPFPLNYEFVMFYSTGPRCPSYQTFFAVFFTPRDVFAVILTEVMQIVA
jgi:hypothetical protein